MKFGDFAVEKKNCLTKLDLFLQIVTCGINGILVCKKDITSLEDKLNLTLRYNVMKIDIKMYSDITRKSTRTSEWHKFLD